MTILKNIILLLLHYNYIVVLQITALSFYLSQNVSYESAKQVCVCACVWVFVGVYERRRIGRSGVRVAVRLPPCPRACLRACLCACVRACGVAVRASAPPCLPACLRAFLPPLSMPPCLPVSVPPCGVRRAVCA